MLMVAMLSMMACHRGVMFVDNERVDESGWNLTEQLHFDVDVTDTMQLYNFFVDVRNTVDYPYRNTFLFINTAFPDGSVAHDTLECPLADVDGRWLGKQTGHYISNRYFLRKQVRFPMTGNYHFAISHGMRDTNIVGIKNIGLCIEKAQ